MAPGDGGVGRERSTDGKPHRQAQRVMTDTGGARPGDRSGCREFEVENGLK